MKNKGDTKKGDGLLYRGYVLGRGRSRAQTEQLEHDHDGTHSQKADTCGVSPSAHAIHFASRHLLTGINNELCHDIHVIAKGRILGNEQRRRIERLRVFRSGPCTAAVVELLIVHVLFMQVDGGLNADMLRLGDRAREVVQIEHRGYRVNALTSQALVGPRANLKLAVRQVERAIDGRKDKIACLFTDNAPEE